MRAAAAVALAVGTIVGTARAQGQPMAPTVLDVYGSHLTVEDDYLDADADGGGFGGRLFIGERTGLFGLVEGQRNYTEVDDADADLDVTQYRGGLGYGIELLPTSVLRLRAEYVYVKGEADISGGGGFDGSQKGFGLHLSDQIQLGAHSSIYGEVGYMNTSGDGEDADGPEFLIGAEWMPHYIGWFIEYRYTDVDTVNDAVTFGDARLGIRFTFGAE